MAYQFEVIDKNVISILCFTGFPSFDALMKHSVQDLNESRISSFPQFFNDLPGDLPCASIMTPVLFTASAEEKILTLLPLYEQNTASRSYLTDLTKAVLEDSKRYDPFAGQEMSLISVISFRSILIIYRIDFSTGQIYILTTLPAHILNS